MGDGGRTGGRTGSRTGERFAEDRALRAIVEGVEAETGEEFFRSLVRYLASALGVQYALVSEFTEDRQHFRTRAVWGRGQLLENLVVPLRGSPCEAVLNGQMSHHPERLQELFAEDVGLATWGVHSYCGVPLLDTAGMVVGHLAIFDDQPMPDGPRGLSIMRIFAARARAEIERARAKATLADNEARLRDLYEEAPVAYYSIDREGRIRHANRRALEIVGATAAEMIGRSVFDFWADTPAGRPRARRVFERFLAGIETRDEEIELQRADGALRWMSVSVRPIRDAQGGIEATRTMLVDITDRKRAEEALRASEERLDRIFTSAMDAIVTLDDAGRIEMFNRAAEGVFRCAADGVLGRPFERFLTDGFRQALDNAIGAIGRDPGTPYAWIPEGLRARRADGQEFPVEASISHAEVGGRRLFTLILRDVDERRRVEAQLRELHRQNEYLQEEIKALHNFDEIVGQSAALGAALKKIGLVAGTDSSVLILGETGTGKELIARAVHSNSPRRARPLIKVNCAALPSGLIESELFGHERGAFTGATERRIGRFELAHGGTIFLDEIGDMPAEVQAKLLRVLQEHEFERVGGGVTIRVDVRVIAATNRDLEKAVAAGTFRQDLYYRLNVFPVLLPPLRARTADIPLLVHYFVGRFAGKIGRRIARVPEPAMARLADYPWPGNVRELENVIERAVILSAGPELDVDDVLLPPAEPARPATPASADQRQTLEEVERIHIVAALKQTRWRIDGPSGAARLLDLHPSTLRSRMQKLGIRRSREEG